MAFNANSKLLSFIEKLKTTSGKYKVSIITWSFLPFAVCVDVILNPSIISKIFIFH